MITAIEFAWKIATWLWLIVRWVFQLVVDIIELIAEASKYIWKEVPDSVKGHLNPVEMTAVVLKAPFGAGVGGLLSWGFVKLSGLMNNDNQIVAGLIVAFVAGSVAFFAELRKRFNHGTEAPLTTITNVGPPSAP